MIDIERINDEILGAERQALKYVDQEAKEWMRMALFTYGRMYSENVPPSLSETTLHYCYGYGCTDIQLIPPCRGDSAFFMFRLFGRGEIRNLRGDVILQIHAQIASIVQDYFPGAKWTSLFAVCAHCLQEDEAPTPLDALDRSGLGAWRFDERFVANRTEYKWLKCVNVCTLFDGVLLCWPHKEIAEKAKYEQLRIEIASQQTPQQVERQKMSSALRFRILQRDSFTCQACGQSPRKGHSIALHVDHIYPIAKGGKTEDDNLHVLCESCNNGKRDKVIPELLSGIKRD